MKIKRCRDFSRPHDYGAFAVVRVFNGCLDQLGGRNAWVTISTAKAKLYRRAMGAGGTGLSREDIELDYDSRLELGIEGRPDENNFYDCDLNIQPSGFFERFSAHWKHPNLAHQVPYKLAILSVALGAIGLLLGVVSILQ